MAECAETRRYSPYGCKCASLRLVPFDGVRPYGGRMKWIDLPPVWLLGCLVLTWLSPWEFPWGRAELIGIVVFAAGLGLAVAAVIEFRRAKTTVIPRLAPSALISSGVFRYSRNPIYLADVLILVGLSLYWGKLLGILLVPIFIAVITKRFILGEEARLRQTFGADYATYLGRTRRWF